MSDNIKVVVKVRPLISREIEEKLSYQWRVNNDTLNQLDQNGREFGSSFTFDKVYDKDTKTREVYNDVAKPIVEAAIAGFNGTIFAYGQTSSGKTYTMTGTESSPGIIPLAVLNLFETIKNIPDRDFLVRVSYIEIYNETLRDLLDINKKNIKIHDTIQGLKVDATEKVTSSPEEVLDAMKEGEANRQTGATNMNEESSRSHSIFQITIESREHIEGEEEAGCVNVSQLNLVDLAGSERSGQTGATGIRFKEGTHINKSLSVLALVIKQLSEDPNKFANYRDSKLTRILQNSLGGNAKTSIICAITPASVEETISTLQFANRAKAIKNKPEVNAVATNATMIQSLTKQLSKLQSQLESKKNVEQNNATLQKRIEAMRKMILNGFNQRCSLDMMGTNRRKQQPLRRITISTLHPIEEDPVPNVPRFCTPSLKYNPMSISTEFLPIQSANNNKLASLPEETRTITPPPRDKKVDINDEIIELDSDDDTEVQECSPYHKCYGSSKTPPCILRKNAKLAEKSLKDIVELTEREKMYVPTVVELIEKLEQNTSVISKLEDEISALSEQSKNKDLELEQLRNKISKTEEQVQTLTNAKAELEILCNNYTIKLTDWEVSYDTLKKKAKSREDDLLSLLEEQKVFKKSEDIGKLARKELDKDLANFMDMSKDISLVNSDNESNVTNVNDDESSAQIQELVTELQSQLTNKNQTVIELESNIFAQKKKIESLENSSHELQTMINSLKEKFSHMETENTYLKSTVETLNSTINSQKLSIEKANNDIQSYNTMIEDLQVKLNKKDTLLSVNITDSVLESMIANEERFIANNDNMKNLIYSFKMTLDCRNKEIESLKSTIQSNTDLSTGNTVLKEQVETKEKQIFALNEEIEKLKGQLSYNVEVIENLKSTIQSYIESSSDVSALKDEVEYKEKQNIVLIKEVEELKGQLNENIEMIENLKSNTQSITELSTHNVELKEQVEFKEKQIEVLIEEAETLKAQINENLEMISKLMSLEKQLCSKVYDVEEQNTLLQTNVDEKSTQIKHLNEQYEKLTNVISEKEAKQQEISDLNEKLTKRIDDMSQKIADLEEDITSKDSLISSLNNIDNATQNHLSQAKLSVHKLHNILTKLKCNTHGGPEVIDNIEPFFSTLDDNLNTLETKVTQILEDNKENMEQTVELKEEITSLLKKYQSETEKLQMQIGDLSKERNEIINQYEELSTQLLDLTQELDKVRQEQEVKDLANIDLETKLNDAKESNENLRNDLLSKDDKVLSLQEKISALNNEIELMSRNNEQNHNDLKQKIDNLNANQESLEQMLKAKDTEISVLQNALEENRIQVTTLTQNLDENRDNKDQLLEDILNKVYKVTYDFSIENNLSCDIKNGNNIYEKILLTLDKIANHIMIIKTENNCEQNDVEVVLSEAKQQITDLTQKNLELMEHLAEIEIKNKELFAEMEKIKKINSQLSGTNEFLDQLKIELEVKASDLEKMEVKANELKTNFEEFECVVKEQMKELQTENELLKDRISESKKKSIKHDNIENNIRKSLSNFAENVDRKSPQSLLTICCNAIIEAMEPDENDLKSVTTSSSKGNIEYQNSEKQNSICECSKLSSELQAVHEENSNLKDELKHLKSLNLHLIEEQEEVRKEIQLLVEPANELQKKIINHRTNLSTLTATTYAENKLLNSQLKVLKHHHTRYIHVCQRDIPAFKSQLHELMAMLKGSFSSTDKQNASFKRFSLPDVLDSNNTVSNFNNESTLDGDLLMLDTNVTLTTSADNTLMGNDQSCLDITQINFDSEVACQTSDSSKILDPCLVYSQMEILTIDNQKMNEKLEALQEENRALQEQINKYTSKESSVQKVDAQSSPIKLNGSTNDSFSNTLTDDLSTCKNSKQEDECEKEKLVEEIRLISQELTEVKALKEEIEKKYANLTLEIPSTDALIKKLCILEKEYNSKTQEHAKLTNDLKKKNIQIKDLQEENDTLSNQLMENISEADDLRKKLEMLKEVSNELEQLDNVEKLKETTNSLQNCPQCKMKDELINTLQSKETSEAHSKLNRSLSDSDSSSRFTKIYTLQNELHASKEDCKKITEEVATIKNQLDRSNLTMSESMDLDGSIGDSNIFTFNTDYGAAEPHLNKFSMPNIPEERPSDMYTIDKIDCFNYYAEITDANKENLNCDVKIIDVMKMLYDSLVTKHGNEVENLVNKLRDFEESKNQLQTQIDNVTAEYSKITKDFELKDNNLKAVKNVLSQIRDNIKVINEEIPNAFDSDKNSELVNIFKENLLQVLDSEFNLSSVNIFESLINNIASNHETSLNGIMKQYTELQQHVDIVMSEFTNLNEHMKKVKSQLADKENEASLLREQKERLHEISNVVTKDIVELHNILTNCYERLKRDNIMKSGDIDLTQSLSKNVNLLFERLINPFNDQNKSELEIEKKNLILEVNESKKNLEEKDKLLESMKMDLLNTEEKLQAQLSLHEDVNKLYENSVAENMANVRKIDNLTEEIKVLQQTVLDKESNIQALESEINFTKKTVLSENQMTITELTQKMKALLQENESLNKINEVITKEKESYSIELEKSCEIINKNKAELDRMTADILILRETVRDNVSVIESLTLEARSLIQQNEQMKKHSKEKCQNCSRLEVNIKTHEKTAEIQSRMIMRLQKQKEQDDQAISDRDRQLEELTNKCLALQKECEDMKDDIKTSKYEIDGLKNVNQTLETRVSELEMEVEHANKPRLSIDVIADNARKRRQSLHDSQRVFAEHFEDHNEMEAVFGSRAKPDDLFMDVDDNGSNRSTPNRLSKGRDSIHVHSDRDEESSSRPSSVLATRRRRQSTHDLHRSVIRYTPSPHDSIRLIDELKNLKSDTSGGLSNESEVSQLRQCLTSCQQELEEWKEKYKELDDECETCAQYLRERDDQCVSLKKEKADLEKEVAELNDKLKANVNLSGTVSKPSFAHASVNTDEDWANLHSVVVDRMSFDAEVEKNKKLTKTIEELRYKNQGLKNTLVKMQNALEKHASYKDSRELEVTKSELKACKQELEELKQQYKELDEECEICAQYLRERDEQCQKLKTAKAELEAKLQELQEDSGSILKSVRKKRQSLHDQNRAPSADLQDATTETSDDFLSYQVRRDESSRDGDNALARELKQFRTALEKVSKEKAHLEQMMSSALPAIQPTMFVATGSGIVQNQQLTDVMKENHKLKKMNAKLIQICKKRGKSHESNRENEEPTQVG